MLSPKCAERLLYCSNIFALIFMNNCINTTNIKKEPQVSIRKTKLHGPTSKDKVYMRKGEILQENHRVLLYIACR